MDGPSQIAGSAGASPRTKLWLGSDGRHLMAAI